MTDRYLVMIAAGCIVVGVGLIVYGNRRRPAESQSVLLGWLLACLAPPLVLFGLFPDSLTEGTVGQFTVGGAFGAYVLLFWVARRFAKEALADTKDKQIRTLIDEKRELEDDLVQVRTELRDAEPQWIHKTEVHEYAVTDTQKKLCLVTGDLTNISGIDLWVNPENTLMEMARRMERSVSGTIRHLGGTGDDGTYEDLIGEALDRERDKVGPVSPFDVLVTESGRLRHRKRVEKILHVASVHATPGKGFRPVPDVHECVRRVLERADTLDGGYESILIPLLGTGLAGGNLRVLAPNQLLAGVQWLQANAASSLQRVYFLTGTEQQLEVCQHATGTTLKGLLDAPQKTHL